LLFIRKDPQKSAETAFTLYKGGRFGRLGRARTTGIDQFSSGSSLIDDSERCRRLGRGLRRDENFVDVGLEEGEAPSSLRIDEEDDDGDDGEELYIIYGSLSS